MNSTDPSRFRRCWIVLTHTAWLLVCMLSLHLCPACNSCVRLGLKREKIQCLSPPASCRDHGIDQYHCASTLHSTCLSTLACDALLLFCDSCLSCITAKVGAVVYWSLLDTMLIGTLCFWADDVHNVIDLKSKTACTHEAPHTMRHWPAARQHSSFGCNDILLDDSRMHHQKMHALSKTSAAKVKAYRLQCQDSRSYNTIVVTGS